MGVCFSNNHRSKKLSHEPHKVPEKLTNNSYDCQKTLETNESFEIDDIYGVGHHRVKSKRLEPEYIFIPNKCRVQNPVSNDEILKGLVGLKNLGNTCFMNSALQCLLHTTPLADYFLRGLHFKELNLTTRLGSMGYVTLAFARLMKQYWMSNSEEINPQDLHSIIRKYAPRFGRGTEEDCHELLAYLLDILHEDLNLVKNKPEFQDVECENDRLEEFAQESWNNYLMRDRSIIVDLFQGQSKNTLKCLQCGYTTHKFEPFMYISLPVPSEKSDKIQLLDCLNEYSKEEMLEEKERWTCPKCKMRVEATKKLDIWKLPNILIIHLKRFRYDKKSKEKLTTFVDFPIVGLDLSPIAAGVQRDKPIYDLFAVSNHKGSLDKGHYYTFAKNREDNSWYAYNDSEVMTLLPDQIASSTAYLLFFCKTSIQKFERQSLTRPEAWPHVMSRLNLAKPVTVEVHRLNATRGTGFSTPNNARTYKNKGARIGELKILHDENKIELPSIATARTASNGNSNQKRFIFPQQSEINDEYGVLNVVSTHTGSTTASNDANQNQIPTTERSVLANRPMNMPRDASKERKKVPKVEPKKKDSTKYMESKRLSKLQTSLSQKSLEVKHQPIARKGANKGGNITIDEYQYGEQDCSIQSKEKFAKILEANSKGRKFLIPLEMSAINNDKSVRQSQSSDRKTLNSTFSLDFAQIKTDRSDEIHDALPELGVNTEGPTSTERASYIKVCESMAVLPKLVPNLQRQIKPNNAIKITRRAQKTLQKLH